MSTDPWIDDQRLDIDGVRFIATSMFLGDLADQFVIVKPPDLVRRYLSLFDRERPQRIVELGIKDGGSTALIALAAQPEKLLAADLEATIPPLLASLIESRDLDGRVFTAFGLDQSDRSALTRCVSTHMADRPLDLVIDDASHILGPTRTSFEVLFPRLRPGGLYVIEDWSSECVAASYLARALPDIDVTDRLGAVNQLFHVLNAPGHEVPPEVLASMAAVADEDTPRTDAPRDVFERLVDVAVRSDLAGLEDVSIGQSRPLADFAVELMMISATNPEMISEVHTDREWLTARRGPADLPLDQFRLEDCWSDYFGYLT